MGLLLLLLSSSLSRVLLELLLRERRSAWARAKIASDRSEEEQHYVTLDRVLRPMLYEEEDRRAEAERQRRAKEDMSLEDAKTGFERLGDQYEPARREVEQVDDQAWRCRWSREQLEQLYRLTDRQAEDWPDEDQRDDVLYVRWAGRQTDGWRAAAAGRDRV